MLWRAALTGGEKIALLGGATAVANSVDEQKRNRMIVLFSRRGGWPESTIIYLSTIVCYGHP
jgi:hypothetical protein